MIATHNPFAAREYIRRRLARLASLDSEAQARAGALVLLAEIDTAIGEAIRDREDGQLAAYESAKVYLQEKLDTHMELS